MSQEVGYCFLHKEQDIVFCTGGRIFGFAQDVGYYFCTQGRILCFAQRAFCTGGRILFLHKSQDVFSTGVFLARGRILFFALRAGYCVNVTGGRILCLCTGGWILFLHRGQDIVFMSHFQPHLCNLRFCRLKFFY